MYLELSDIAVFSVLAVVAMIWWQTQAIRQIAIRHASQYCKRKGLQFLDEGISLNIAGLKRNSRGSLSLLRRCRFEFSATGDDRYQGEVIMLGKQLVDIKTPPYREPEIGSNF